MNWLSPSFLWPVLNTRTRPDLRTRRHPGIIYRQGLNTVVSQSGTIFRVGLLYFWLLFFSFTISALFNRRFLISSK